MNIFFYKKQIFEDFQKYFSFLQGVGCMTHSLKYFFASIAFLRVETVIKLFFLNSLGIQWVIME